MNKCAYCPFKVDDKTCRMPIGKKATTKSPREHYRQYFNFPCDRDYSQPHTPKDLVVRVIALDSILEEEI